MTILLYILGSILGIISLLLIIAAFLKKKYNIERSVAIERNLSDTYEFISSLQNQDGFSKWANIDPDMKKEYLGIDRTIGFTSRWESNHKQVGTGEQEITKLISNERMETKMRFFKPFKGEADGYFITSKMTETETKVSWGFNSKMPYPFNIMLVLFKMEEKLGADFELGLQNMKNQMENPA